ncbi:MAG: IS21-like element helper ATPase IstB [Polyangiaceae bacterium]|nr:IS21-like element helper ATPase IstB [Polyangiaceae bacterium]
MTDPLIRCMRELKLTWMLDNHETELADAARANRSHHDMLLRLLTGELEAVQARSVERRIRLARLPARRTLDTFDWHWPEVINRDQIQHLFSLAFLRENANVVFIGGVGLGKTHLASALALHACERGHSVLFTSAVDIVNTLAVARAENRLKQAIRRYVAPRVLTVDELGYLPVDRVGAELLFQVLGERYEKGSTVITTNRPYRQWATTFANDATLTSAVLDRVVHHCETVIIKGRSYRLKDRVSDDPAVN